MSYTYNRRRKNIKKFKSNIAKGIDPGSIKCNSPEEAQAFVDTAVKMGATDFKKYLRDKHATIWL